MNKNFPYGTVAVIVIVILLLFAAFMYLPDWFKSNKTEKENDNKSTGSTSTKKGYCTGAELDLNKTLNYGTNGNEVCVMQRILNEWLALQQSMNREKDLAVLNVDGMFGPKTQTMLQRFKPGSNSITLNGFYKPNGFAEYNKTA